MVDGDVETGDAVTHTRIAVPQEDGSMAIEQVLETLHSSHNCGTRSIPSEPLPVNAYNMDNEYNEQNDHISRPNSPRPKRKNRVSFRF
jgi:hypothetical protein